MAKSAYFPGWNVVIGSGVGISFGSVPFFASGFALLASAMAKQFGWSQPDVAKAATIYLLLQTFTYPLCGIPLDRWGSRKFAVISIALFAASLVILSQIDGSLTQYYLAFALMGIVGAGTNVVSYARAIALWFNRKRGLALGFAASSQAVGSFVMPILAQKLIVQYGWSTALIALAVFEVLVCLPLVALLVKDSPVPYGLQPDGEAPAAPILAAKSVETGKQQEGGLDVGDIVRTATFWKLAVSFAIMGMTFYAIVPNIVYILTKSAGLSLAEVAQVQAASGIAVLFGRIGFGYLLDKMHAPYVAIMTLVFSAICSAVYAASTAPLLIVLAAVIGGFAIGGETDLMPYLASRYFGTRAVSKIFGWFLFAFFLGAAVGPLAFAQLMATYQGASTPLLMLVALQIVPAALFFSLGRYQEEPGAMPLAVPANSVRS